MKKNGANCYYNSSSIPIMRIQAASQNLHTCSKLKLTSVENMSTTSRSCGASQNPFREKAYMTAISPSFSRSRTISRE
ncbi:unnamed protein product [Acanthoscelides obtectus]|uniref:Uncharacterized protein n=1 Tax=Acanthoscelides obtectus TaxID=200917 RepID=A0A9P0LUG8_ACAOB|nr:unnamed protein product [Acanthoscelides obtectus]CAK1665550.1 hypothetical protein AOBTE_LOCUS24877 [Acanthoscelides obtectus]